MDTGKKIFLIMGIALGVFMVVYIGSSVSSVWNNSKNQIENSSDSINMDCLQYSFKVKILNPDHIEVENSKLSSFNLNEIIIEGISKKEIKFKHFPRGDVRDVELVGIDINDTFKVYPKNCASMYKECSLSSMTCD